MGTQTDKIKQLLNMIPAKDIPYATEFFNKRDFESLRDLVKSDIIILRKKKQEEDIKRVELLRELKAEIDSYLLLIGKEEQENENFWGE